MLGFVWDLAESAKSPSQRIESKVQVDVEEIQTIRHVKVGNFGFYFFIFFFYNINY